MESGGFMQRTGKSLTRLALTVLALALLASAAHTEDLLDTKCSELVRLAEAYQQDLKTVDTVLGSAIDSGDMDRIKNYKLKKGAVKKNLESVLKAIELKGCIKTR
jgi:hypothetical protein